MPTSELRAKRYAMIAAAVNRRTSRAALCFVAFCPEAVTLAESRRVFQQNDVTPSRNGDDTATLVDLDRLGEQPNVEMFGQVHQHSLSQWQDGVLTRAERVQLAKDMAPRLAFKDAVAATPLRLLA